MLKDVKNALAQIREHDDIGACFGVKLIDHDLAYHLYRSTYA
jgi:hypothetical protein